MGRPRRQTQPPDTPVSNSAADRAGEVLRRVMRDELRASEDALAAYRTASLYRDMHNYPMTKVTNGVRHYVQAATGNASLRPGQRHKRLNRIMVKLVRHPHMRLSQMEDIGGCRVVLNDLDQVYEVVARIRRRWHDVRVIDYIENPKPSGYRAVHLIERRDGRLIEVQLRTRNQHAWAAATETWVPPAVAFNLKDEPETAPEPVRRYFEAAAESLALEDSGQPDDDTLEAELQALRPALGEYVQP
jgi:putative GTP pyrophosphokinase